MKAKEILLTYGHEGLSIRKIATEIEYSPATIYLYFQDKDDILHELMESGFKLLGDYMRKEGGLPAGRRALSFLRSKAVVAKLFSDVASRFRERPGGYTRIIRTRRRIGDAAEMVAIELVIRPEKPKAVPSTDVAVAEKKDTTEKTSAQAES